MKSNFYSKEVKKGQWGWSTESWVWLELRWRIRGWRVLGLSGLGLHPGVVSLAGLTQGITSSCPGQEWVWEELGGGGGGLGQRCNRRTAQ